MGADGPVGEHELWRWRAGAVTEESVTESKLGAGERGLGSAEFIEGRGKRRGRPTGSWPSMASVHGVMGEKRPQ
jgi:hypothetical protein